MARRESKTSDSKSQILSGLPFLGFYFFIGEVEKYFFSFLWVPRAGDTHLSLTSSFSEEDMNQDPGICSLQGKRSNPVLGCLQPALPPQEGPVPTGPINSTNKFHILHKYISLAVVLFLVSLVKQKQSLTKEMAFLPPCTSSALSLDTERR